MQVDELILLIPNKSFHALIASNFLFVLHVQNKLRVRIQLNTIIIKSNMFLSFLIKQVRLFCIGQHAKEIQRIKCSLITTMDCNKVALLGGRRKMMELNRKVK